MRSGQEDHSAHVGNRIKEETGGQRPSRLIVGHDPFQGLIRDHPPERITTGSNLQLRDQASHAVPHQDNATSHRVSTARIDGPQCRSQIAS